ncbi:hypothetical protein [Streptomyces sp. NPDC102437]|uniref:hypothetical protein n=1 Tax=Streptomyces sp. NPDC102437 TaxID=3366175 RepID=UPI0038148E71
MSTTTVAPVRAGADGYVLRTATPADLGGARAMMLDTVYRDLKSGYVPRWHADMIDPAAAYLRPDRCTLLVVEGDGEIVATGAVRDRGPQAPPNPQWVADRFPPPPRSPPWARWPSSRRRRSAAAREDRRSDPVTTGPVTGPAPGPATGPTARGTPHLRLLTATQFAFNIGAGSGSAGTRLGYG